MYNVFKSDNLKYGIVIEIVREDLAKFICPFEAFNKAKRLYRKLITKSKVRFLIDGQVLSIKQAERWALYEYKSLPKCKECGNILNEQVYTNNVSINSLFCRKNCADKDYMFQMEIMNDEYECDYK